MSTSAPRRTQAERREATITALVDATVESLGEVGYHRTTIAEICGRAAVSTGGLFRHFDSRLDLVLRAADEVRGRQFDGFRAGLAQLPEVTVEECLRLLRAATRAPMNAAWYELLVAARTDAELRSGLQPLAERYHREIAAMGRSLPVADTIPPDELDTVLMSVVHMLDGEAVMAVVHAHPEQEDRRIAQLVAVLGRGGGAGSAPGD